MPVSVEYMAEGDCRALVQAYFGIMEEFRRGRCCGTFPETCPAAGANKRLEMRLTPRAEPPTGLGAPAADKAAGQGIHRVAAVRQLTEAGGVRARLRRVVGKSNQRQELSCTTCRSPGGR